jgi:cell fate (sporulation/competence/biofilm development) regulator YlbF (YheA/YmcA/DUF963 family)
MPTQEDILSKAKELGSLVAASEQAARLTAAAARLRNDASARQVMAAFNQLIQALSMKEQTGQPITPEERNQLERAQTALASHLAVQAYQQAQVAYVQLMRDLDDALTSAGPDPLASPFSTPQSTTGPAAVAGGLIR